MAGHLVCHVPVCTLSGFPHILHIGQQFSESSGTSNTLLSLGFGILLLLRLIMLAFLMLILLVVGLTEKRTSGTCHFLRFSLICWSS
jgi:hypothetical protein